MNSMKIAGGVIGTAFPRPSVSKPSINETSNNIGEAGAVHFPESVCGSATGRARKILVAYASQFGTTGEIAQAIGEVLCDDHTIVETRRIQNVENLIGYDAVIIGSAIQYDKWMPEATEFVSANQVALGRLPVAFFFACLALSRKNDKSNQQAKVYSDKLYVSFPLVKPLDVGGFAGVLEYSKMPFILSLLARGVMTFLRVRENDYRDWDSIRSWAKDIKQAMELQSTDNRSVN